MNWKQLRNTENNGQMDDKINMLAKGQLQCSATHNHQRLNRNQCLKHVVIKITETNSIARPLIHNHSYRIGRIIFLLRFLVLWLVLPGAQLSNQTATRLLLSRFFNCTRSDDNKWCIETKLKFVFFCFLYEKYKQNLIFNVQQWSM